MIEIAIQKLGGLSKAARRLGSSTAFMYHVKTGRKPLPPIYCPSIERYTQGECTVEQLRPDVAWARVPDPSWPHPAGRPCIDVATSQRLKEPLHG